MPQLPVGERGLPVDRAGSRFIGVGPPGLDAEREALLWLPPASRVSMALRRVCVESTGALNGRSPRWLQLDHTTAVQRNVALNLARWNSTWVMQGFSIVGTLAIHLLQSCSDAKQLVLLVLAIVDSMLTPAALLGCLANKTQESDIHLFGWRISYFKFQFTELMWIVLLSNAARI